MTPEPLPASPDHRPQDHLPRWPAPEAKGALAPRFMLPDQGGLGWNLTDDTVAGRPLVLVFLGGFSQAAALQPLLAFRDLHGEFEALGASVVAITRQTVGINADARESHGIPFRILSDLTGEVSRRYAALPGAAAARPPLAFVVSPAVKVARVIGGSEGARHADQALAAVEDILAPRQALAMALHPPVLQVPDVLSPAECRFLIALHQRDDTPWNEPGDPVDQFDFRIRVGDHRRADRVDYVINEPAIVERLDQHLAQRLTPEIKKAFQYRVTRRETYHIACYQGRRGGFSIGHRDNTTSDLAHRRFALSINLNDGEYEGGELRFREYGEQRYRVPTGSAMVFSSSLLHEAMAVTAGRRYVLLSHLFGDDAAQPAQAPKP